MSEQDEVQRLRRRLRAMAALNLQLRAQLEALEAEPPPVARDRAAGPLDQPAAPPPPVGAAPRRGTIASDWLAQLPTRDAAGSRPALVARTDGTLYVVEAGTRRRLRSGVLAPALEALLGERRLVDDAEFHSWAEGPPVEALEAPSGLPFVVLGGRRLPLRGLPLPYPVDQTDADRLPEGPEVDVAAALVARRAYDALGWIPRLAEAHGREPASLVVAADGATYVVEAGLRRRVRSGLLTPALEQAIGDRRPAAEGELEALPDGPDVEVLEARSGAPFVVVGGKRLAVRGLPLPHPVEQVGADRLPDGPAIDVVAPLSAALRRAADAAQREADREAHPDPVGELKALVDQKGGVTPTAASFARKGAKRLTRRSGAKSDPAESGT